MTQQVVNVGSVAGDGTGDKGQVPFNKTNANFTELYGTSFYFGVDSSVMPNVCTVLLATLKPNPTIFPSSTGTILRFTPANANTGAATLNGVAIVNSLGAALTGAELQTTSPVTVEFNGTAWQILTAGTAAALAYLLNALTTIPVTADKIRTAAEIAASVTPVNYAYPPGVIDRYGTNTTPGTTDMTTAVQNAVNSNSSVTALASTYLVGTINLPVSQYGFRFFGAGPTQTIFQAKTTNTPVFQKTASAGALEGAEIGGFSIKAHTSGSTTTAFLCTGFRTSKFTNIRGLSNGSLGFASLFSLSATPYLCYGNEFDTCGLAGATGWAKVWDFNNNSTGVAANNANITVILNPWIYFNTGLSVGIDALRSTGTTVIGGLIESNSGATAINVGQGMTVQGTWLEANAADLSYQSAVDGTANQSNIIGCHFSTPHSISFTGCQGNIWIGNNEQGVQTWTGNNGTNVRLTGTGDAPSAPTVTQTGGSGGTLTFISATVLNLPNLSNALSYILEYTWTPTTAATFSQFTVAPPTNWALESLSVGMTRNASGQPRATAINGGTVNNTFSTDNVTNDAHSLTINVTISHNDV